MITQNEMRMLSDSLFFETLLSATHPNNELKIKASWEEVDNILGESTYPEEDFSDDFVKICHAVIKAGDFV